MGRVRPGDTIVVAFLDRFSRNFEEGVRIQAELTSRDIGIIALRENIDTSDGSAAAKFFRRSMLAQGAYQVDSASERIKLGLDRVRAGGKRVGRPPALTQEQVEQCRRMADEGAGLRQIARVMQCSPATVKRRWSATSLSQAPNSAKNRRLDSWTFTRASPGFLGPLQVTLLQALYTSEGEQWERG